VSQHVEAGAWRREQGLAARDEDVPDAPQASSLERRELTSEGEGEIQGVEAVAQEGAGVEEQVGTAASGCRKEKGGHMSTRAGEEQEDAGGAAREAAEAARQPPRLRCQSRTGSGITLDEASAAYDGSGEDMSQENSGSEDDLLRSPLHAGRAAGAEALSKDELIRRAVLAGVVRAGAAGRRFVLDASASRVALDGSTSASDSEEFVQVERDEGNWVRGTHDAVAALDQSARALVYDLARVSVASLEGEAAQRAHGPYRLPGSRKQAARSATIYLLNCTGVALSLARFGGKACVWPILPPSSIESGAEVVLASSSLGGLLSGGNPDAAVAYTTAPDSVLGANAVEFCVWWETALGGRVLYRSWATPGWRVEREYLSGNHGPHSSTRFVLTRSLAPLCLIQGTAHVASGCAAWQACMWCVWGRF